MKLTFWSVGSKHDGYVKEGIETFTKRIGFYFASEWKIVAPPKNAASLTETELRNTESNTLIKYFEPTDFVILLDERGKMLTSPELALILTEKADNSIKKMHFIIGGAYGVNEDLRKRANLVWQLSKLVFPHQLVRLILAEQIYRACTITKNEKYHHS